MGGGRGQGYSVKLCTRGGGGADDSETIPLIREANFQRVPLIRAVIYRLGSNFLHMLYNELRKKRGTMAPWPPGESKIIKYHKFD